jgi:hypothetical protein
MKIAELLNGASKRKKKVTVRVPAKLQAKLGTTAKGTVLRIVPKGSITWVEVKIGRNLYNFRPQDLSPA